MKKLLLLSSFLVLIGCMPKIALSSDYWQKPSKVGLVISCTPPTKFKEGSQGLLDMAVTSGDKYKEALNLIGEQIQPKGELTKVYAEILKSKGKDFVIIDENFDYKTAPKFNGKKEEGKKYSTYDFSNYKAKFNVDEVLFVNIYYGFMISYYGMIETGKMGHTSINTQLIDLNDQHLLLSHSNVKNVPIKKWKDNNYENSINAVRATVDNAVDEEKNTLK